MRLIFLPHVRSQIAQYLRFLRRYGDTSIVATETEYDGVLRLTFRIDDEDVSVFEVPPGEWAKVWGTSSATMRSDPLTHGGLSARIVGSDIEWWHLLGQVPRSLSVDDPAREPWWHAPTHAPLLAALRKASPIQVESAA
jgi:hypothetical protein